MSYLRELKLVNFRCYDNKKIEFTPKINIITGNNAVGKTTIAEGISYLAIGKSFKNIKEEEIIKDGEDFFNVIGFFKDVKEEKIVVYGDHKGKKITINEETIKRMVDFLGLKGLVSFSPDDLKIIKGSPLERRRFLDTCLCQIDNDYLNNLMKYNKLLKERNEILKNSEEKGINYTFLDVLDEQLIKFGFEVVQRRKQFIYDLLLKADKNMKLISGTLDGMMLSYSPKLDVNKYKESFLGRRNHDLYLKTTTGGPHRDDVEVLINNKIASETASQGQIRCAIIALKIGFYELLKEKNDDILVIMDDVLSELDEFRQNKVLELLDNGGQIFITCTNVNSITPEILKNNNVIHIGKD